MKRFIFQFIFLSGLINLIGFELRAQNDVSENQTRTPRVEKVELPNWWANHSINPVRLLVRGANFKDAKIASKNNLLKVSNVKINPRGDYLFFDVTIAKNAKPAKYDFEVSTLSRRATIPFEISAPLDSKTNFQGITNDEGRTAEEQKIFNWTKKWINLRKGNVALQKGFITDLFYDNDIYVFSRSEYLLETQGIDSWQYIIATFNNSNSKKDFSFGSFPSWFEIDSCFVPLPLKSLSKNSSVCFDNGSAKYNFTLPPKSAQVFIAKEEFSWNESFTELTSL